MQKTSFTDEMLIDVAKNLYKYQNFKGDSVVKKFPHTYYKDSTIKAMLSITRNYLSTGDRSNKRVSDLFYDTIDNCKSTHVQPLVPSENEKMGPYRGAGRRASKVKTIKPAPVKQSTVKSKSYDEFKKGYKLALQVDDIIKVCPNQSYIDGYIDAFKQMEKQLNQTLTFKQIKIAIVD